MRTKPARVQGGPDRAEEESKDIILGWKLDSSGDPEYWMSSNVPRPGGQSDASLVTVSAKTLGSNTIIVAQSGSGKSSFLARIVEELLLSSSANCLIVDPNSDFRYFPEVGDVAAWTNASFDAGKHSGKLHTERNAAEFKRRWSRFKNQITILTGGIPGELSSASARAPTVRWQNVPLDFLMDGLDSVHRVEMRHCRTFFNSLAEVYEAGIGPKKLGGKTEEGHRRGPIDILRRAEQVFTSLAEARSEGRLHGDDDVLRIIEEELSQRMPLPGGRSYSEALVLGRQHSSLENVYFRRIARSLERAVVAFGYFSDITGRHYFGLLEDLRAAGILSDRRENVENRRVEILDLPSIKDRSNRNLLVASFLDLAIEKATREWEIARSQTYIDPDSHPIRHPFFIVLDEAHNLIPGDEALADPSLKLVRDRFRIIAAEGRKLGLFLILATQRPDKIDKFILSECQNKAVMRLDNQSSLTFVAEALGMQDAKSAMRKGCMGVGYRVLLSGRWTDYASVPVYPAPRRTMEGGGGLEAADWAPYPSERRGGTRAKGLQR